MTDHTTLVRSSETAAEEAGAGEDATARTASRTASQAASRAAAPGGMPRAGGPDAPDDGVHVEATDELQLDSTLRMDDLQWLEHAIGDLHSSAWTVPNVEL